MASLQFEGVLGGLSEEQDQFIREVLEKRGFKKNKVLFEPASKTGDNFLAQVLRITVEVEEDDDFVMIGKFAPRNEDLRDTQHTTFLFRNEAIIYDELLPKFTRLQIEAGIPESERLRYARTYGCLVEEPNEVVLLEDLKQLDYTMLNRLEPMTEDAVLLVLKNFAKLHAMSFVFKHIEPETYKKCSSRLTKMWDRINQGSMHIALMEQVELSTLGILTDEFYKKAIRGISKKHLLIDKTNAENNPKYLVIQQGDAWTNNIMFKVKEGKPVDAIMIDYQLASESSPAADIIYFIFNCTNYDARSKNYFKWIDSYHEELDKCLSFFNLKASFVYPKSELHSDLKRYAYAFFGITVLLNSVLARSPEEAAALHEAMSSQDQETMLSMQVNSFSESTIIKYKSRIEELIDSYRDFGYLQLD